MRYCSTAQISIIFCVAIAYIPDWIARLCLCFCVVKFCGIGVVKGTTGGLMHVVEGTARAWKGQVALSTVCEGAGISPVLVGFGTPICPSNTSLTGWRAYPFVYYIHKQYQIILATFDKPNSRSRSSLLTPNSTVPFSIGLTLPPR